MDLRKNSNSNKPGKHVKEASYSSNIKGENSLNKREEHHPNNTKTTHYTSCNESHSNKFSDCNEKQERHHNHQNHNAQR